MSFKLKKKLVKVANIISNNKSDKNKSVSKLIYNTKRLVNTRIFQPHIQKYFLVNILKL
jgi:hypothetical protein